MTSTGQPSGTRVGFSTGGMLLFRGLGQITTFAVWIILSRYLGPELFGRYNYLYGWIVIFAAPLAPALNDLIVREALNRPDQRKLIFGVGSGLRLLLAAGAFIAVLIIVPSIRSDGHQFEALLVLWAALGLFFSMAIPSWRYGLESFFQTDYRMDAAAGVNLLGRVVLLGILSFGVLAGFDLEGIVGLQAIGESTATLFLIILCLRMKYPVKPMFSAAEMRFQFRESIPLIGTEILVLAYTRLDILFLEFFRGEAAVGFFAAPVRLVDAFQLFVMVFIASAMPIYSRIVSDNSAYADSSEQYRDVIRLSYKAMTVVALLITVPLSVYARDVIELFYGSQYMESVSVMVVAAWSIPFAFAVAVYRTLAVASHRQSYLPRMFIILTVINIGLNCYLAPRYGAVGAAWAKVATYGILFPISIFSKD
ncbi:MAG: flippase, partial [Candidatus Electryoneaceae bacterium]|nr:flippase [Candidatus Electryoneaceae bacterium]